VRLAAEACHRVLEALASPAFPMGVPHNLAVDNSGAAAERLEVGWVDYNRAAGRTQAYLGAAPDTLLSYTVIHLF